MQEPHSTASVDGEGWGVGGLVGSNWGFVEGCYATGGVEGGGFGVGGLVGVNTNTVANARASGEVLGKEETIGIGGLVGHNMATLTDSFATGAVSGGAFSFGIGGLTGQNGGEVQRCYATGDVSGDEMLGGLVGSNISGTLEDSYATGAVSGGDMVGGLVGFAMGQSVFAFGGDADPLDTGMGAIRRCYSVGAVSGRENLGGLLGVSFLGDITASFWDLETSGQPHSSGGTGLTTGQMMQRASFENEGWDFEETWTIVEGITYPSLRALLAPDIAFILSPVQSGTVVAGDTLRFSGSEMEGAAYSWDLGGGRSFSGRDPGLVGFPEPGAYDVVYSVTTADWPDGSTDTREFVAVEDTGDLPDLRVANVQVPDSMTLGEAAAISYTVRNEGQGSADSPWQDAVYLSRTPHLDIRSHLLASAPVAENVAAGASYHNVIDVTVPADTEEGAYYLILSVDDQWEVLDRRRLDNQHAVATDLLIPRLEEGVLRTVPHPEGYFENHFYLQLPLGNQGLVLTFDAAQSGFEFFVRHGASPTRGVYDYRSRGGELVIPGAVAGNWHVLVSGRAVPDADEYTLLYETVELRVSSASPSSRTIFQPLDLTLTGTGFYAPLAVELIGEDGTPYAAESVEVASTTRLTAHFPAGDVPPGMYAARVSSNGASHELPDAVEILAEGEPNFEANLILPARFGYHVTATVYVEYSNTGNAPMQAPLLMVTARQNDRQAAILTLDGNRLSQGFWTSAMPVGFDNHVMFLASGETVGILQPGERRRVPVYYAGWQQPWDFTYPPLEWEIGVLDTEGDVLAQQHANTAGAGQYQPAANALDVDWDDFKDELKPDYVREDAWDVVWDNFKAIAGDDWAEYVAMLARNADYLGRVGERVDGLGGLLAFAMRLADGLSPMPVLSEATDAYVQAAGMPILFERKYMQPISRRHELGPLGRGWTHGWQYTVNVADDDTVAIVDWTGTPRFFQPDSRFFGRYQSQPGDPAELRGVGGGYRLTEPDGTVYFFENDRLQYVEDTNGNRITCEYSGGQLTTLSHTSGGFLDLAYSGGRIVSVTDHHDRQTQYTYNGEYLTGVEGHDGRAFAYSYHMGGGAARHALTEIAWPDGTTRSFDYDTKGRLSATWRGDQEELVTISHTDLGQIVATDASGNATRLFFDHWGRLAKVENPLGEAVLMGYDEAGNLTSFSDPAGMTTLFSYDGRNNLTWVRDAAGAVTRFEYTRLLNRLATAIDARGIRMQYDYDDHGNLTSITYADGSSETWSYDARGNPQSWTNRRGRQIAYTFDAAGRITGKVFQDGSSAAFRDDGRGNLAEAENDQGTTAYTYDSNDYLVRIDYPHGRWLAFTYDAAGRRASSEDHLGRVVSYHYDDAGRLSRLSEGGDDIVAYSYDELGRLAVKETGNGVYTEYEYDPAGRLKTLVNRKPGGEILSTFSYTYDRRGRRVGMATHYGEWSYEYDDLGQLVRASLASIDPDVPDQDIQYTYDAVGNRVLRLVNGEREGYQTNHLNQHVQIGDRVYTYDADGNLIEEDGPEGPTLYTYDDENRLVGVTRDADEWEYAYDALGHRVVSVKNGAVTHYVVDPIWLGDVVGEYDGDGNPLARYDHGFGLVSRLDPAGDAAYYTFDGTGNVSELTGPGGAVHNAYVYRPFGETLKKEQSLPNPFQFVGELGVMAEEHGLSYMRARFYDPRSGKFTSMDPIGIVAGDMNLYRYVFNNPVTLVDPSGLFSACATAGGAMDMAGGVKKMALGAKIVKTGVALAPVTGGWSLLLTVPGAGLMAWGAYDTTNGAQTAYEGITGQGRTSFGQQASKPFGPGAPLSGFDDSGNWSRRTMARGTASSVAKRAGLGTFCAWENLGFPMGPFGLLELLLGGTVGSFDPNQKLGVSGHGEGNHVPEGTLLSYQVDFENLEEATAPAQIVTVRDPLSEHLDLSTLEFAEIGFGDFRMTVPPGLQYFETVVDYAYADDEYDFEVEVHVQLWLEGRVLSANFISIDPDTGLPPPVEVGFLPPETDPETGRGQGFVSYVIRPNPDLPSGTEIRNVATIQFDFGLEIDTNQVDPMDPGMGTDPDKEALVTFDTLAPTSSVTPLPEVTETSDFTVSWTGQDDEHGSGIAHYDVYVQEDGGAWSLWRQRTAQTSADFQGEDAREYSFYSVATDNVGNREEKAPQAEATTRVEVPDPDETDPPVISQMFPADGAWNVRRGTSIRVRISDHGSGVDPDTVGIQARMKGGDWEAISDGSEDYAVDEPTMKGRTRRAGDASRFLYSFQPAPETFDYEDEIEVRVIADDILGNEGEWHQWSFVVETRTFGESIRADGGGAICDDAAIARDLAGNDWVAWQRSGHTGMGSIAVAKRDGRRFGEELVALRDDNANRRRPAIAISGHDIWIAYEEQDASVGGWAVRVARSSTANPTAWIAAPSDVARGIQNVGERLHPRLAVTGQGTVYLAFQAKVSGIDQIVVSRLVVGANDWDARTVGNGTMPALAVSAPGRATVVWRGEADGNLRGANSTDWDTAVQVTTGGNARWPSLAPEASGQTLHLAWEAGGDGSEHIRYAKLEDGLPDAPVEGENILDEDDGAQGAAAPRIAVAGSGEGAKVFVAWHDRRSDVEDDFDIHFAESRLRGGFGTNILVNDDDDTRAQTRPAIGLDTHGSPVIAWTDGRTRGIRFVAATRWVLADVPWSVGPAGGEHTFNVGGAEHLQQVTLAVPPDTLPIEEDVTAGEVQNPPLEAPGGLGVYFHVSPGAGGELVGWVRVTVHGVARDLVPSPLRIYRYVPPPESEFGTWTRDLIRNVSYDAATEELTFETKHLSVFGAGGGAEALEEERRRSGSGGGCSMSPFGPGDWAVLGLPWVAIALLLWRYSRRRRRRMAL